VIIKAIEIRDIATFIPAVAIKMEPANVEQGYLLRRVGFLDGRGVTLMRLVDQRATSDPYEWSSTRTMTTAHTWLIDHFDELSDGDVVDVEFILGETAERKKPEREEL
jgi:hypothetical protein